LWARAFARLSYSSVFHPNVGGPRLSNTIQI
jgi:hypothetical protein